MTSGKREENPPFPRRFHFDSFFTELKAEKLLSVFPLGIGKGCPVIANSRTFGDIYCEL